jgi:hypothetical protein
MIRKKPDGTVEADTPEELVAYEQATARASNPVQVTPVPIRPVTLAPWPPPPTQVLTNGEAKWSALLSRTGEKQKVFMRLLRAHPDGVSKAVAMEAVGVDTGNHLAGIIGGGLAKHAKAAGFEDREVYIIKWEAGEPRYRPGPALLKHDVP